MEVATGCYIGRDTDPGLICEWKAQLLKNQNMLSAAHLSSGKCPRLFGMHYNGNCSRQNYLVWDEPRDRLSETCMSIGSISWSFGGWNQGLLCERKSTGGIDINISSETLNGNASYCFESLFKKKKRQKKRKWEASSWNGLVLRWRDC